MAVQSRITQSAVSSTYGQAAVVLPGVSFAVNSQATGGTTIGSWQIECLSNWDLSDPSVNPTDSSPVVLASGNSASPSWTYTAPNPTSYLLRIRTWPTAGQVGTETAEYREFRAGYTGILDCVPARVPNNTIRDGIKAQFAAGGGYHDNFGGIDRGFSGSPAGPGLSRIYERLSTQTTLIADGTANQVLRRSAGGTLEFALLTSVNLASGAAIAPTQLSAGGTNKVIQGAATAGAQAWTDTPTVATQIVTTAVRPSAAGGATNGTATYPWGAYYGALTHLGGAVNSNAVWGYEGYSSITSGGSNLCIMASCSALTSGFYNILIGRGAGAMLTEAQHCMVMGPNALSEATVSVQCMAFANGSMRYQTGSYNTAGGYLSGRGATGVSSANYITCWGHSSGLSITTGDGATLIGASAGDAVSSGTGATAVGRNALGAATTATDASAFGNGAFATGNYDNSTALGAGAQPNANDQVWLGNASANTWVSNLYPKTDDTYDIGDSTHRFDDIYATNATIQTSDEREKQDIAPIDDTLLDAWEAVQWVVYRWRDAAESKGDAARYHHGLIAQQLRDALATNGIDACRYGLVTHDTWDDQIEEVWEPYEYEIEEDAPVTEAVLVDGAMAIGANAGKRTRKVQSHRKTGTRVALPAGDRWGLRYAECMAVEAAWTRRELMRTRAELAKLTKAAAKSKS